MSRPLDDMIAERVAAMTVAERKEYKRWQRRFQLRHDLARHTTNWMHRIPYVGSAMYVFWYSLIAEGISETCTPRWGAMTFSFLNEGFAPTVWHTLYQMTHDNMAPYSGIYHDGAPTSLADAKRKHLQYKEEHEAHNRS